MSSVFLRLALAAALLPAAPALSRELRVCADPNNLPFSNDRREGFENKIVDVVAQELHASVSYTWWAQRRGFVRNTLDAELCDLVPGIVTGFERLKTSRPYYRSGYVFVTRADADLQISSLDDPRLKRVSIGVQLVGDDGANPPPAHALARRGIVENVRGYSVYGDYSRPNPAGQIVAAVASGEIDVAIVWGPLAGFFARHSPVPLTITPVFPLADGPTQPMAFDISMGVRRDDKRLRDEIDAALSSRRTDIDAILAAYAVPRIDMKPEGGP